MTQEKSKSTGRSPAAAELARRLYHLDGKQHEWGAHVASRAGFGAAPKRTLHGATGALLRRKVRDDDGVIASTRGACAPQKCVLPAMAAVRAKDTSR
ncbi:MAG: hypothetical protein DME60_03180 [Verrucomicrobia bacterium]|nr:MAG: hypothetical protein DME60_03180 [Verrucomicrobiota bacterium]